MREEPKKKVVNVGLKAKEQIQLEIVKYIDSRPSNTGMLKALLDKAFKKYAKDKRKKAAEALDRMGAWDQLGIKLEDYKELFE